MDTPCSHRILLLTNTCACRLTHLCTVQRWRKPQDELSIGTFQKVMQTLQSINNRVPVSIKYAANGVVVGLDGIQTLLASCVAHSSKPPVVARATTTAHRSVVCVWIIILYLLEKGERHIGGRAKEMLQYDEDCVHQLKTGLPSAPHV